MKTLIGIAVFLIAACAHSQSIYRCGNAFTQLPCGADAKVVQAPPVRLAALSALPDNPPEMRVIEANKALCKETVRSSMKDPESARMGTSGRIGATLDYANGQTSQVVTYYAHVNAKNSYDGYTGEKLYKCSFDPGEKRIIRTAEIGPAIR